MLSEEERRKILEKIEASETMKKRYEEAPSERCREHIIPANSREFDRNL